MKHAAKLLFSPEDGGDVLLKMEVDFHWTVSFIVIQFYTELESVDIVTYTGWGSD
jgi:hypothetical protein